MLRFATSADAVLWMDVTCARSVRLLAMATRQILHGRRFTNFILERQALSASFDRGHVLPHKQPPMKRHLCNAIRIAHARDHVDKSSDPLGTNSSKDAAANGDDGEGSPSSTGDKGGWSGHHRCFCCGRLFFASQHGIHFERSNTMQWPLIIGSGQELGHHVQC